ncbi:hypothetical protein OGAPHI_005110 [Ogataea philodendri]|uniref:ADP-ribosylation factor n=1 Tax=Ogataea philodendri TaxID=1378263 RepID=A0A9P8T307_9ASCO|nr:uncharacterized protein OGAPHI_005110 [Ogataea philodendri]KAH3663709.1 hypothetical protein OGAPHI_005110 [Ogataea philodendri]
MGLSVSRLFLKLGNTEQTVPTVGFNVETIKYKNLVMNTWDVGGQDRIRALWRHYFSGTDALIFVVDSADEARLPEAKKELYKVINDRELTGCLLCVLANKQDLPHSMKQAELAKFLELESIQNHNWCIIPTVATDGTGLNQADFVEIVPSLFPILRRNFTKIAINDEVSIISDNWTGLAWESGTNVWLTTQFREFKAHFRVGHWNDLDRNTFSPALTQNTSVLSVVCDHDELFGRGSHQLLLEQASTSTLN